MTQKEHKILEQDFVAAALARDWAYQLIRLTEKASPTYTDELVIDFLKNDANKMTSDEKMPGVIGEEEVNDILQQSYEKIKDRYSYTPPRYASKPPRYARSEAHVPFKRRPKFKVDIVDEQE